MRVADQPVPPLTAAGHWEPGTPAVPAHLDPSVGTVSSPSADPTGTITYTADPTDATYRHASGTVTVGVDAAGTPFGDPIHSAELDATGNPAGTVDGAYLSEPFNALTAWSNVGCTIVAGGRTGNAVQGATSGASVTYTIPVGNRGEYQTIGFAVRTNDISDNDFLSLRSAAAANQEITLTMLASGAIRVNRLSTTLGTTAAGLVTLNTWHYLELRVRHHNTLGAVTLRWNGTDVLTLTNVDTFNAATIDTVRLERGTGATILFDDLYLKSGAAATFAGDVHVGVATPAVSWRFDAADYPGTGLSYVDPRGRTWTLSTSSAIVAAVPEGPPVWVPDPPHPIPPNVPMGRWPGRPVIALEVLPQGAYAWDDPDPTVIWDQPFERYVWDAPATVGGFTDVTCDMHALEIIPGDPDDLGLFGPTQATLTLRNADGRFTVWSSDGRLTYWAPGRRFAVWADVDGELFWVFAGRITTWTQGPDPDTVTVEAWDGLHLLAQEKAPWTAGAAGQLPRARIESIAAATGYSDPIGGDPGTTNLATEPDDDLTPLDACQRVTLSDGGIFAADADGTLIYRDRLWRAGRSDQSAVHAFTDNVCTGVPGQPTVVWDAEQAVDDLGLHTRVELVNLDGVTVTATLPDANPASWWQGVQYRLVHPDPDLWQTAEVGQTLADYLLASTSTPAMAVRAFGLWLHAPQLATVADWRRLLDLRRGDRFEWVSDFTASGGDVGRVDIFAIIIGVAHLLTPESWVLTVTGSRTVEAFPVTRWDETLWTWDDPDPLNVWRY